MSSSTLGNNTADTRMLQDLRASSTNVRPPPNPVQDPTNTIAHAGADRRAVDPWFNFRATKYLVQNGFYSFWDWFDDSEHHHSVTMAARQTYYELQSWQKAYLIMEMDGG